MSATVQPGESAAAELRPARRAVTAAIAAVGVSVPANTVPNAAIAARLGVSDEWIERRTGIRSRHFAEPEERLATHAAGRRARAGPRRFAADELDLVLVATTTRRPVMPNAGAARRARAGRDAGGWFDIGAACTGFLSALAVGAGSSRPAERGACW